MAGSTPKQWMKPWQEVLRIKFELGLFENPYTDEATVNKWNGNPAHKLLAREAAEKSMVLLKNDNNLLPLKKSIGSIAVIGVDATEARLGGYSGPWKWQSEYTGWH
jgi:beta-glucosidase